MGGGLFDNMWDPYSGAYSYPRPRYYRPRGAQAVSVPVARSSHKVEEPLKKMFVKTIPVTYGNKPVPVAEVPMKPRLKSEDAAAMKIQAVYRGYALRKTQPLKHLKVIKKVKEELENFQGKLQETEQWKRLCSDSQERLRWTEGTMALLLRLDSLQSVHPEVRLIRKALSKELIRFEETIDSMSIESAQFNGQEDVSTVENTDAKVIDAESAEGMEIEESTSPDQELSGADFASVRAIESNSDIKEHVPQLHPDMKYQVVNSVAKHSYDDHSEPLLPDESMIGEVSVVDPSSTEEAHAEVRMGVENNSEQTLTTLPQYVEVELAASSQNVPSTGIESDDREDSEIVVIAPSRDVVSEAEEASVIPNVEMCEPAPDIKRGKEIEKMAEEAGRPSLDSFQSDDGNSKDVPSTDVERGHQDNFAPSENVISETDINDLSDRALLLQVLKENRRLRDVVGEVLQWGKQRNDVITDLASRIERLEEPSNLLHGEENYGGRKKIANGRRSEIGLRRGGKAGRNRPRLGYIDSEGWHSAESDDYF